VIAAADLAVVHCSQLITVAGPARPRIGNELRELAIVPDGALRIRDGRIAAAGPRAEIERGLAAETKIVDAGGCVVMPGFVDAHTHAVFAGTRVDEYERRAAQSAQAILATVASQAKGANIAFATDYALSDHPATAIVEAARRHGCDAIFMSTHARTGWSALVHGSETHDVLVNSDIPTLVYR